jgi:asparagine synthase (glutamine-hydrolysing)
MCGICGFLFTPSALTEAQAGSISVAMAAALTHRGPDDSGAWVDGAAGVALSHRRLSILDLSPHGRQPMQSTCGRYTIVFNGEIYNHRALRQQLSSATQPPWRGHSDTEVMLAAIQAWGLQGALRRFSGMFAFALWDRQEGVLSLARDRLGEKPLYYGWQGGYCLFGSELKALRAHPAFTADIDRDALAMMMRFAYVPMPHSIFQGIHKLPPGCTVSLSPGQPMEAQPQPYWSLAQAADNGRAQPFAGSEAEAADTLEALLSAAVAEQMVADVPLGAFLSGGIDSSLVVALMRQHATQPVKTFTIGFWEADFNEAQHAKAVAQHLGTEHNELYVPPQQALQVIPQLPALYDEPFADSSQIPTFLVAQLAREQVTVSLSGDGGDELFGGYNRYFWAARLWRQIGWMPAPLRAALARALTLVQPSAWDRLFRALAPLLPTAARHASPGDKLHKLAQIIAAQRPEEIYRGLVSFWKDPSNLVLGSREPLSLLDRPQDWPREPAFEQRMMYLDQCTYLPDDILVKVDRAAMGVSLETRVPMLDHRLVEFAWSLPLAMKIRHGQGKHLLRQVLYRHVPKALIERPKMGFGIPLAQWLRGPLRDWTETLLNENRLRQEGYLHPGLVTRYWREHLSGRRNWSYYLWNILIFQAWLECYRK